MMEIAYNNTKAFKIQFDEQRSRGQTLSCPQILINLSPQTVINKYIPRLFPTDLSKHMQQYRQCVRTYSPIKWPGKTREGSLSPSFSCWISE